MATISSDGSKGHHTFSMTISQNDQDISGNKSTIGYSFQISAKQAGWDWAMWGAYISFSCSINGRQVASGQIDSYNGSSTVRLAEGTVDVGHNADGTKNVSFSFSVSDSSGVNYTCGSASDSGTMQLTTIPRASIPSYTGSLIVGQKTTFKTNRASDSFKHNIYYSFGGIKDALIVKGATSSFDWVPDAELLKQIPNATSGKGTLLCETYSGSTKIGSKSIDITINSTQALGGAVIDSMECIETNPVIYRMLENNGTVRYLSSKRISFKYHAQRGATIKEVKISNGTQSISCEASGSNTVMVDNPDGSIYTLQVKDSRGYVAYKKVDHSTKWYPYEYPTLKLEFERKTQTGSEVTIAVTGTFYNATVGSTSNFVVLSGDLEGYPSASGGENTFGQTFLVDVPYNESRKYHVVVKDVFSNGDTKDLTVTASVPTFFEGPGVVAVAGKFYVDGEIIVNDVSLKEYIMNILKENT